MDGAQGSSGHAQASKQTTERIQALSEISKKIPQILQHAGLAINALTRNPLPPTDSAVEIDETGPLAANKMVFKENYGAFLTILTDITNALNEEADAMVEAKLLPEKPPPKGELRGESHITNEGLGNLDIGYLNSRTRDVGLAKERELIKEMRVMLEKYVEKVENVEKGVGKEDVMDQS